jgi:hypothetical protein
MATSNDPAASETRKQGNRQRIGTAVALGVLLCVVLWNTDFSFLTALTIGSGTAIILVGASFWSMLSIKGAAGGVRFGLGDRWGAAGRGRSLIVRRGRMSLLN